MSQEPEGILHMQLLPAYRVCPLCNVPYMPQGQMCHKPDVHNALCITILICHSRQLFKNRMLCVTVMCSLCHRV